MKRLTYMLIIAAGVAIFAQATTAQTVRVQINQERQTLHGLTVKFLQLVEDSRCPSDTNCVWAGNAKIKIAIRKANGASKTFEMNTGVKPQSIAYGRYRIKLTDLTPHPRSNIRINRNGYVATFMIRRI
ncbi:MAG: hypothetical protein LC730_01990 [Acidobacteria bacterium]|nr:hypothetical protein [Acidobacteriota bacterium]MCA1608212.1 hypothetical protein [Acidobacteriota bacterium]